eukprot:6507614-Heterocapsa_arctica.AAC.1
MPGLPGMSRVSARTECLQGCLRNGATHIRYVQEQAAMPPSPNSESLVLLKQVICSFENR